MNNSETRTLMEDVFADRSADGFRAAAMRSMLGAVRRRKRIRRFQNISGVVVMLTAISLVWLRQQTPPTAQPPVAPRSAAYEWVVTGTFDLKRVVRTRAGFCTVTGSRSDGFVTIESRDSRRFVRALDDEGLLGLFADRAVALVHRGPGEAALVFPGEDPGGHLPVQ